MSAQTAPLHPALPRSHYFLTISRGADMRTFALRALVVQVAAWLMPLLLLCLVAESLYLAFHDDLMAAALTRQTQMQDAYEDRIAALRNDLEQQASRRSADQARVEAKVHDLFSRAEKLELRAETVAALVSKSGVVHTATAVPVAIGSSMARTPRAAGLDRAAVELGQPAPTPLPEGILGYAPVGEFPSPHATSGASSQPYPLPEDDDVAQRKPGPLSSLEDRTLPVPHRLSALSAFLDRAEEKQVGNLAGLEAAARGTAAKLRGFLEEAGLSPGRFAAEDAGVGGPFVPLPEGSAGDAPFARALVDLQSSVGAAGRLRVAISHVPLAAPSVGPVEITSPFGPRLDPFLGRPSLHTGMDIREDYGAEVRATAPGRVTTAGPAGGYGNMVEIDHGYGLITRFAHMSDIDVVEGQTVSAASVLGHVGATGRATGPHLHYEIRIDGEPVDPARFLSAGTHLAQAQTP